MNWNKIKTLVLTALGITALVDNTLTAEQEETIKGFYGEDVLAKFKANLKADKPEENATELFEAMKAAFAPEAAQATADVAAQLQVALADGKKKDNLIATLMNSAEDVPVAETNEFQGSPDVPKVMNVTKKASHYMAATAVLKAGSMSMAQGATIDVADLRQEFGAYLSQNGNNLSLTKQIFSGFTSSEYFRSVPALTEYRALQAQINSVVQKFKPKWTPQATTKFTGLKIKNFRHKINVPIIPAEVLDSYLFHLYDETLAPAQMPITKYIWNELINPKILDDIEKRMIFKGKFVENDNPNEATAPEDSMDGILTQLIEEKANVNTRVNFYSGTINWATASDAEVIAFINGYADWVDEADLSISKIFASKFVKRRYQRAYEALYGTGNKQVGGLNKDAEVDYVELEIVSLKGMKDSPVIFSTVEGNMVKLRHKNEVPNIVNKVVEGHYTVDIIGEFWLGAGFEIAEFTFAYVPASYTDAQVGLKDFQEFPDGTTPVGLSSAGSGGGGI